MGIKWTKDAQEAYQASGKLVKAIGGKPIREIADKEANAVLTFWATPRGLVVTQVFTDTGDVVYLKDVQPEDLAQVELPVSTEERERMNGTSRAIIAEMEGNARTRTGNTPTCDECGEQHSQERSCEEYAAERGWNRVTTECEMLRASVPNLSPLDDHQDGCVCQECKP